MWQKITVNVSQSANFFLTGLSGLIDFIKEQRWIPFANLHAGRYLP